MRCMYIRGFLLEGKLSETGLHLNRQEMEKLYDRNFSNYERILADIVVDVQKKIRECGFNPSIKYRVKSFKSFFAKKLKLFRQAHAKPDAILPITDVLGIRIITPFMGDISKILECIKSNFIVEEIEDKGAAHSFKEFGYESIHVLIKLPEQFLPFAEGLDVPVCEIQLRTILQDAWAEVEHELIYKSEFLPTDEPLKRKLASLNAMLSLSDMLFQELRDYQHALAIELSKRRDSFISSIESIIDKEFTGKYIKTEPETVDGEEFVYSESLDEMLLHALNAHNAKKYDAAIRMYTHIIEATSRKDIQALIYKHRGMAYFSKANYKKAIEDFKNTLAIDPTCYKASYYIGIVYSVLKDYDNAIKAFSDALREHPAHFYSLLRRAQAYYHKDDLATALADCEAALLLDPTNQVALTLKQDVIKKLEM